MRGSDTPSKNPTMAREAPGTVVGSNGHRDSQPHRGTTVPKLTRDGRVAVGLDLHPAQNHSITQWIGRPRAASGAVSYQSAQLSSGSIGALESIGGHSKIRHGADLSVEQRILGRGAYLSEVRLISSRVALPRMLERRGALLLRSGAT
jgi:hypothetical protein